MFSKRNKNCCALAVVFQSIVGTFFSHERSRAFFILILLSRVLSAAPPVAISRNELSDLVGETTEKVTEIRLAREAARERGFVLATYGGTSREVVDFVTAKVNELGSVAKYRAWLSTKERIHLLDFHKINSDLDFMVIPRGSSTDGARYGELVSLIQRDFPGNIFYKKMDLNHVDTFFAKYPASGEHFEAISNIPISERGIERIPQLDVLIDGSERNLAEWGADQYINRKLEFRRLKSAATSSDVFGDFRQVLRWIRYASENPHMTLTGASRQEVEQLLHTLTEHHKPQVLGLLSGSAGDKSGKILEALEKLQLYSRDSIYTRRLLDDFGITQLASEAGVKEQRILEPLRPRDPSVKIEPGTPRLGQEVAINHRTNLAAAQNISLGARWISNNQSVINGRTTGAAEGPGIYGLPGLGAVSKGDIYVGYVLSPDAVIGVDVKLGGAYVIQTLDAVARNPDGSLKIDRVDMAFIQKDFLEKLKAEGLLSAAEKEPIIRGLSTILQPELHPSEARDFYFVLSEAEKIGQKEQFLRSYLQKRGVLTVLLKRNSTFAREFFPSFKEFIQRHGLPGATALGQAVGAQPSLLHDGRVLTEIMATPESHRNSLIRSGLSVISSHSEMRAEFRRVGPTRDRLRELAIRTPELLGIFPWDSHVPEERSELLRALSELPRNSKETLSALITTNPETVRSSGVVLAIDANLLGTPGHKAIFEDIFRSLSAHPDWNRELKSDQAIAERLSEVAANHGIFQNYPVDLAIPSDVRYVQKTLAAHPKTSNQLRNDLGEIAARVYEKQPRLAATMHHSAYGLTSEQIRDPELARQHRILSAELDVRQSIESKMAAIATQDHFRAAQVFPEYDFRPEEPRFEFNRSAGRFYGHNFFGEKYAELLNRLRPGSSGVLTQEDRSLVDFAFTHNHNKAIIALLNSNESTRNHVLDRLRQPSETSRAVMFYRRYEDSRGSSIGDFQTETHDLLYREINNDPHWKGRVRSHVIANKIDWKAVPWDLNDARDVSTLRAGIKEYEKISEELRLIRIEFMEKYGIPFHTYNTHDPLTTFLKKGDTGHYANFQQDVLGEIGNPEDRRRLERALHRYRTSQGVFQILDEFASKDATTVKAKFGDLIPADLRVGSDALRGASTRPTSAEGRSGSATSESQIHNRKLSLNSPTDMRLLSDLLSRYPKTTGQLAKEIENIAHQIYSEQPKLAAEMKGNSYYLDSAQIRNTELASRLIAVRAEAEVRGHIEQQINSLFEQDFIRAGQLFPEFDFRPAQPYLEHNRSNGQYKGHGPIGEKYGDLLNRVRPGSNETISLQDRALIDLAFRYDHNKVIIALLNSNDAARGYVLSRLRTAEETPRAVMFYQRHEDNRGSLIGEFQVETRELLHREISNDPEWKNRVRSHVISNKADWKAVPWNLADPKDVSTLRAAIKDHDKIADELRLVRLDLMEKYGVPFHTINVHQDYLTAFLTGEGGAYANFQKDVLERIIDPLDKAKFERALHRYEVGRTALSIVGDFGKTDISRTRSKFGDVIPTNLRYGGIEYRELREISNKSLSQSDTVASDEQVHKRTLTLTKPDDLTLARSLLVKYPRSSDEIRKAIGEVEKMVYADQPQLGLAMQKSSYYLDTARIRDPQLMHQHSALHEELRNRQQLESQMSNLAREDFFKAVKAFPNYDFEPEQPQFHFQRPEGKIIGTNFLGTRYAELINRMSPGSTTALTENDRVLIDFAFKHDHNRVIVNLLNSNQAAREYVLSKLKQPQETSRAVMFFQRYENEQGHWITDFQAETRDLLAREINKDPQWKARVRAHVIGNKSNWEGNPWDLNDPRDVNVLRAAVKEHDKIAEELRVVRIDIMEKYGIPFHTSQVQSGDPLTTFLKVEDTFHFADYQTEVLERITAPTDRSKLERALRRYRVSSRAKAIAVQQLNFGNGGHTMSCAEVFEMLAGKGAPVVGPTQ